MRMMSELERLRADWNDAWLRKDDYLLDELMAEDFVFIAANGALVDRIAVLELIRSPDYEVYEAARTEVAVSIIAPDAAAVVHRRTSRGSFSGAFFRDDQRCTMICVRRHEHWQVLLEQCSPIIDAGRTRATMTLPTMG